MSLIATFVIFLTSYLEPVQISVVVMKEKGTEEIRDRTEQLSIKYIYTVISN